VLTIFLSLVSAVGYGSSDFAAGLATRRASVIRVTVLAEAVSVAVVGVALALNGADLPSAQAAAWGAVAGVAGVAGAMALYLGFRHAAFSVAATLSAVGSAGFSVLAGLLLGERPTALALTGIALALPAIAAVSASAHEPEGEGEEAAGPSPPSPANPAITGRRWVPAGVSYGLVAGACFALLFIGLNQAGASSGLWPVFCSQVAALVAVVGVAAFTRDLHLPEAGGGRLAAVAGLTGGPGTILFFLATHHGLLAVAAVITSLYPAVTIMLARVLLGERLTAVRLAGLSLAAASVALIAVGGAG
jgi:drug/metabolite transporter (DMT)-like permease